MNDSAPGHDANPPSGHRSVWIDRVALAGSAVTVVLTVVNAYTKGLIDKAGKEIEDRLASVEESRERVQRYQFVYQTLSGITKRDSTEQVMAIGIAQLALDSSESRVLFAGWAVGSDSGLRIMARRGALQAQAEGFRDIQGAIKFERAGYAFLIAGNLDSAAGAFGAAERAFPTYHQVYELERYLRRAQKKTTTPAAIAGEVLSHYAMFATDDERRELQALSR